MLGGVDRLLTAIALAVGLLGVSVIAALRERSVSTSRSASAWRGLRGLSLALASGVLGILLVFSLLPSAARLLSR